MLNRRTNPPTRTKKKYPHASIVRTSTVTYGDKLTVMEEIKRVEYYHNDGEIYRLNGDLYDRSNIAAMTAHYQIKYASLAAEINVQNGVLVMHLSHNENNGIRYAVEFFGISPETREKIENLS